MIRSLSIAVALTWTGLAGAATAHSDIVTLSPLDEENYDVSRESVVQLLCADGETSGFHLSRAVALDYRPANADYDLLLATRHGVHGTDGLRRCRVRGVPEWMGEIVEIRTGHPDARDSSDFIGDWAILRTRARLPQTMPRMRVLAYDGVQSGEVTMLIRPVDRPPCDLPDVPVHLRDPDLILHGCTARNGLSGSPLVTQIDGQPFVVGLHVGRYSVGEEWRQYGVARRISGDFLLALTDLLDPESDR